MKPLKPAVIRVHDKDVHVMIAGQDEDGHYALVDGNSFHIIGRVQKLYGRNKGLITMEWVAVAKRGGIFTADTKKLAISLLLADHGLYPIDEDQTIPHLFTL